MIYNRGGQTNLAHCMVGGGAFYLLGNLRKCAYICPEKFVTVCSQNHAKFRGDLQKKKGHRLIRCTFSIAFGLKRPPNLTPNK